MPTPLSDDLKRYIDENPVFACVTTIQPDGSPQQSITWLTRDGDDLLISTTMDRQKRLNLRRAPRVSVMINPPDAPYTYAEVRGTATLTTKGAPQLIDKLSRKYTGQDYVDFNPAAKDDAPRVVVRVTPRKVVGAL